MPTKEYFVAALYSIVLPKNRRLKMEALRDLASTIGLTDLKIVGSTGNLIFTTEPTSITALETKLETVFEKRFEKFIPIIIRTAKAFKSIAAQNPFPADQDHKRISARIMRNSYEKSFDAELVRYIKDEEVTIVNGDLWIAFHSDPVASKIAAATATKRLAKPGTFRSLAMIEKISAAIPVDAS